MENLEQVAELVRKNPLARLAVERLAAFERGGSHTDLRRERYRLIKEHGVKEASLEDWKQIYKVFARAGFGRYTEGVGLDGKRQRNAPERFLWADGWTGKSFGKAVLDAIREERDVRRVAPTPRAPRSAEGDIQVPYRLRGKLYFFDLPADLTKAEANELCDFIRKFSS